MQTVLSSQIILQSRENIMSKPLRIDYKFYQNSMRLCDFTVQSPFDRRYKFHYSCYKNEDASLYIVSIPYASNESLNKYSADFLELNNEMLLENITNQKGVAYE